MSAGAAVPTTAKQAPLKQTGNRDWIDRAIWTERMLAALDNGVKGNKWFSLIDKVYRPHTLAAAWEQVKANKGAAGIDGQSIERFAAGAERYLGELAEAARKALEEIEAWVEANDLALHPDKTQVGDCRLEGQGFEFLGYRFEAGKRVVTVLCGLLPTSIRCSEGGMAISSMLKGASFRHWTR